jgi:antirestriction protein ArdC
MPTAKHIRGWGQEGTRPRGACGPSHFKLRHHRHAAAEAFLEALRADVRHGGDRACYLPSLDCIMLPPFAAFSGPEHYYATSLHEHAHWSARPGRLDRDLSGRFGRHRRRG